MYRKILAIAALGLGGCLGESNTIDRTQPNAIDKLMFDGIWYYRAAVVESNRESGAVEGITSNMDKLRWEITEFRLVGYRSYEFVPYAEGLTDAGRDFFGSPVVAYRILSHFDIQRDYSDVTGVENNVIEENEADRPWHQRRYMRVDWSNNVVGQPTRLWTGWSNYPDAYFSGEALAAYYEQGQEETNVFRPHITSNYFDITNSYSVAPEPYFCAMMLLFQGDARCGAGTVKARLSFRKVDLNDDYEALYYPDAVELKDDSGDAIVLNFNGRECGPNRDPGECEPRTFEMNGRFGNFRIQRVAFDRERSFTRSNRIYLVGRYDLWEDSYDINGSLIPYPDRELKPVVYYNNVKAPPEMLDATQRMADDWAVPFEQTVAHLKGYYGEDGRVDLVRVRQELEGKGGRMFQIRRNSCNPENIVAYAGAAGLLDVVNRVAGGPERVRTGNVEQVCAAVQFAELNDGKTLDPVFSAQSGTPLAFTWERKGDLRYSINNYVNQLTNGPWGVAQFGQDPETGEYIANQGNYFGDAGDVISQRSVDQLQWLNGDLSQDELFRGDFTREGVVSRRNVNSGSIRSAVREMWMAKEGRLMESEGSQFYQEMASGTETDEERYDRMWSGTDVERDLLTTDSMLRTFAGPDLYQPFGGATSVGLPGTDGSVGPGEVSPLAVAKTSPTEWGMTPETNVYNVAALELGQRAYDMADFFDPNVSGLAQFMKGRSREEIYQYMRRELYLSVQTHELGHAVGLRHNFAGSMDALNYKPEFWGQPYEDQDGNMVQQEYWNNPPTPNNPANRGNEYKYSTIMDYGFDIAQEGWHGIGEYDKAAIRFMYGQIMDVWDPEKVSIPDLRKYGSFARRCGQDEAGWGSVDTLSFYTSPEALPLLFSASPTQGEVNGDCRDNYDTDETCDSEFDALYRRIVTEMEARAATSDTDPNQCNLFVADINTMFASFDPPYDPAVLYQPSPEPVNLYDARMYVDVQTYLEQERTILTNFPEYDDPSTFIDESRDGLDSDEDGVADDKGGLLYDAGNGQVASSWWGVMHPVDYEFCSDRRANFNNPFCQRWDTGWDFTEQVRAHSLKFERDYVFTNFRRDALSTWGNPFSYVARLLSRRFFHMTNVYRYFLFTRDSALNAPAYRDWAEASYEGVNFLERVLQSPEPGTYCLGADNVYRPQVDATDACSEPFTVGLGPSAGRYLDDEWTDEYFYKSNRIGDFYSKWAAILQLTSSSGRFFQSVDDIFDRRAFSLGYLRVFQDPMLQRFAALISGDHEGYRSRVYTDDDGERYVRYTPFFDEVEEIPGEGGIPQAVSVRELLRTDADQDGVEDYPTIEPSWSYTLSYVSLVLALSRWSSISDYAPEYYRLAKISIEGTPEDVRYPDNVAVQTFTDPETKIRYRAPVIEAKSDQTGLGGGLQDAIVGSSYYGDASDKLEGKFRNWGVGANILLEAQTFVDNEYEPARQACDVTQEEAACVRFRRARNELAERVGFIDRVRRINRRAELAFQ